MTFSDFGRAVVVALAVAAVPGGRAYAAEGAAAAPAAQEAKKAMVAEVWIAAPQIVERSETGLVGPGRQKDSLKEIVKVLRAAELDDEVDAVLVRLESFGGGWAQAEDVRRALARVAKKKKVYVHLSDASNPEYLIASAGRRSSSTRRACWRSRT
jgi:hypothetical protein